MRDHDEDMGELRAEDAAAAEEKVIGFALDKAELDEAIIFRDKAIEDTVALMRREGRPEEVIEARASEARDRPLGYWVAMLRGEAWPLPI